LLRETNRMTLRHSELAGQIRGTVKQWFECRKYECVHCYQCDSVVHPSDAYCPNCGQHNPARLAASAMVIPIAAMVLLAMFLWLLVRLF